MTPEGSLPVLKGLSFSVARGQSLAIQGASGSGKTTLLALMAGLDLPSAGEIHLDGQALTRLDESGRAQLRARSVGFIFQSFQLLGHLTALENVMLPLELKGSKDAKSIATDFLVSVGLGERLRHYPAMLSGGEQQRVAIARAFVHQPHCLFADEPTGNLDAGTGIRIADLLFQLNEEAGTTLVLVTHEPRLAERCRNHIVLEAGKMVESRHAD
jgi:putative ABC transport system ATP-binding protein